MKIVTNEKTFPVCIENPDIEKLLDDMCPIDYEFKRAGHEYYTRMNHSLPQNELKMESLLKENTINYFDGWHALSIIFETTDIAPHEVAAIGFVEGSLNEILKNEKDSVVLHFEK